MKKLLFQIKSLTGCVFRPFEQYMHSPVFRKKTRYATFYKNQSLDANMVLYESYFGRGMVGNPYALFVALYNNPDYKKMKHVWVLDRMENHPQLIEQYKENRRVVFVEKESKEYLKYLCKATYLINNVSFPPYFTKKEGQIYVNTWHGIPLKTLGFDLPDGKREVANILRNFMQTDYLLSANEFLTDVYKKAYKLDGLYEGTFIEAGYPRLDLLVNTKKEDVVKKLRQQGVTIEDDKKIILYAPTWRGASYAQASSDVSEYFRFKEMLESKLDTNEYQVLVKVHQRVYELAKEELTGGYFVPATVDANEMMSITDILVSDFSSIFYDFLATGRPVFFYIPDLEEYKTERGLYKGCEELPGPYTDSLEQLCEWLTQLPQALEQTKEKYVELQEWSNVGEVGKISTNVWDVVLGKATTATLQKASGTKKRILFWRGPMGENGITTSFLNLLNEMDYEKYDVSALIVPGPSKNDREQIAKINDNVRVFYRNTPENLTFFEHIKRYYLDRNYKKDMMHDFFSRELIRCFGKATFDYIIDYDGYNVDHQRFMIQDKKAKKIVWQHNDMMAEYTMKYPYLIKVFHTYRYFDRVISCGGAIMEVNKKEIGGVYCDASLFGAVRNFVDIRRVEAGCSQSCEISIPSDGTKFVTMGRLSPEKNHKNLIDAFAKFAKKESDCYLYILGDGPLRKELQEQIDRLDLQDSVILTGNVDNPFAIMKCCDCFILPSVHEGQPMVINEARVMKMPIIMSEFSSAAGVCVENGQLLVGATVEELEKGMTSFLQGKVPSDYHFDAEEYNQKTYMEFLQGIGERGKEE